MQGIRGRLIRVGLIVLLVLVVLAAVIYWHRRANPDPQVVFYQALQHDLTATGLGCTIQGSATGETTKQTTDLDLGGKRLLTTLTLSQKTSTVTTQEIVSGQDDYVRYTAIKTAATSAAGQKPDFSKVLNVWSKNSFAAGTTPTVFAQMTLGNCIVPLAHLTDAQAAGLVEQLRKNDIFKADFAHVTRTKLAGTSVLKYQVAVQPQAYVSFMQQVAKAYGLSGLSNVSASSFGQQTAQNFTFYISPWPGRLRQVSAQGRSYVVTLSDDAQPPQFSKPKSTISSQELLQRLAQASTQSATSVEP